MEERLDIDEAIAELRRRAEAGEGGNAGQAGLLAAQLGAMKAMSDNLELLRQRVDRLEQHVGLR